MSNGISVIITGDIVDSTSIEDKRDLITRLNQIFEMLVQKNYIPKKGSDIFRGDGFQILLQSPEMGMEVAIMISALLRIKSWEARMVIGVGDISFIGENIGEYDGSAFIESGRRLDKMKRNERIRLVSENEDLNEEFEVSLGFLDYILSRWTEKSSEVVFIHYYHKIIQEEIARKLDISQPAVSKHYKTSAIDALDLLCERFVKRVKNYTKK